MKQRIIIFTLRDGYAQAAQSLRPGAVFRPLDTQAAQSLHPMGNPSGIPVAPPAGRERRRELRGSPVPTLMVESYDWWRIFPTGVERLAERSFEL